MGIKDFKLKWVHGMCLEPPIYISNKRILMPSSFFMKSRDLSGNHLQYHFEPQIKIGCCCSLPELGIVAVSERKPKGPIYILSYPKMSKLAVLEQNNNESYSALQFAGLDLLISLQIKNSYDIDLWKWHSGERVHCLSFPLQISEIPDVKVLRNPLWWHECLLQNNTKLILLEVKYFEDKYTLHSASYVFFIDKEGNIDLSIRDECNDQKDFQDKVINPLLETLTIQSACWLPENNILVATSNGIFKVEYSTSNVHKLADNKTGISCMIFSKSGLFIGYKTGYIDIINVAGHRWHLLETIKIDQPIKELFLSPDYSFLTMTTLKGSVFYRKISESESTFQILDRAEVGGEVGIGFLGPFTKLCVTAKKNGLVHVLRSLDGSILSSFQLDEEIVSLATSPLCSCVVIGTNSGFIYFIDITDFQKPKIVHCEKPYNIPVDHLKFDNFGQFLFASAQNQPIKIWNGFPSSGFASLGSKKITTQVKDIAAFSSAKDQETILLILSENAASSDKESGNILIRLKLPLDFGIDPKKYQIDVFGTLSGDALNFQKRKLDNLSSKMDIHWSLGAVFYCPSVKKIHKYSVFSDFSNVKHEDILAAKHVNYIRISPSQAWITLTDLYGCIHLYSCKELVLYASSEKYCASESICKSFIEFPLSSNYLMCGRENGVTLCYEWIDDSNILQRVPEWVMYCCTQSNKENEYLKSTEEEGRLDIVSQDSEKNHSKSVFLNESYEELEMWIYILNFKLSALLDETGSDVECSPLTYDFSEGLLEKIFLHNRNKILVIVPESSLKEEETTKKTAGQNIVKTLSSINLGYLTQNYSSENVDSDMNRVQNLSSHFDKRSAIRSLPNWSFVKCVKMRNKDERLTAIIHLLTQICSLKKEFNAEFENISRTKLDISDRLDGVYFEAKRLTHTLPSKAERDFWSASVLEKESGRLSEAFESKTLSDEHLASNKRVKGSVREVKSSIDSHVKSGQDIREDFDSSVEMLSLKKRYCDYKIYKFEVKIHFMLLFTEVEDRFSDWKGNIENEIKCTEDLRSDIDGIRKELLETEKNAKNLHLEFQKVERTMSNKIDAKCKKMNITGEILTYVKQQPALRLGDTSENPFWHSSSSITADDMISISKEILFQKVSPSEDHKTEWNSVCNKRIRVLKIGVILRNLQTQLLFITDLKQSLADADLELGITLRIMQKALKYMEMLISKCSMTFHSLMITQLENKDLNLEGDPKNKTELLSLSNIPTPDHKMWKNINLEISKIIHLHGLLEDIEKVFADLNKLKQEVNSKSCDIRLGYLDSMKIFRDNLEESRQNITKTKCVIGEIVEETKKNVFKTLKPRILT